MNISQEQFFVLALIIFGVVMVIVLLIVYFVYKHLRFMQTMTRKMEAREVRAEQELLSARVSSIEKAFQQVGHDLHDDIGQMLLVQNLTIAQLEKQYQSPLLPQLRQNVLSTIQRVRALSKNYTDTEAVAAKGLTKSIEENIAWLQRLTEINIVFEANDFIAPQAKPDVQIVLFRIYQECMSNALKHSRAREIRVDMQCTHNALTMRITDDGVGFEMEKLKAAERGVGLNSLAVRARELNARLQIESSPGGGTMVEVMVGLSEQYEVD